MSELPRRPISIWIAQILILLTSILLTLIVILVSLREWSWGVYETSLSSIGLFAFAAAVRVVVVSLFVLAFLGLVRRKRYGRWLAVTAISLIVIASIGGQIARPRGPLEYYQYENSAERLGGLFASLVIYGLFGLLLYRLIFGESVNEFFSSSSTETGFHGPPPPEAYLADSAATDTTNAT